MIEKKKIEYYETEPFKKGFKKLIKQFKTLREDLENAKKNAIELFHLQNMDNQSVVLIPGFDNDKGYQIYKIRKFACKSLKGRGIKSGIRITYAYHSEKIAATLIEMYFKANQENEDRNKIKAFLKNDK